VNRLILWQIKRSRKITDKAVTPLLSEGEVLCWSGNPGFVATFNGSELLFSIVITAVITLTVTIMSAGGELPIEANAVFTAFTCVIVLLFVGWVRQLCRYITTLGMFYAVTDSRLLIVKFGKIAAEMPLHEVKSTAIRKKLWGNGTVVFNRGEDYPRVESPPNPSRLFAFFNVLDPDNCQLSIVRCQRLQESVNRV
jgi:hypothetical protein